MPHTYAYNAVGQVKLDSVSELPASVVGTVHALGYVKSKYDAWGRLVRVDMQRNGNTGLRQYADYRYGAMGRLIRTDEHSDSFAASTADHLGRLFYDGDKASRSVATPGR